MRKTKMLIAALVLSFGFGFAQTAKAQETKTNKSTGKELTDTDLKDMIENMGYECSVSQSEDKKTTWVSVKIKRNDLGGPVEVSLSLSPNKRKLWGHVHLATLKEEHLANSASLMKLLEMNAKIGPNHYRVEANSKALYMSRCTDNRGMTATLLREHIENLVEEVAASKEDWNVNTWGTKTAGK